MPLGYLFAVLVVAGCTGLGLAPFRRPPALAIASWRVGLLIDELPFLVLYYLAASTVLALAQGDVDSPGGWAAFVLAVLAAAGLLVIVRRGLRTRSVLEKALAEGFGSEVAVGRRLPWVRILLVPFAVRRPEVEHVADISYGPAGGENLLDVYRHRSHPIDAPVLVYLHGGGFFSGRKDKEARSLLYRLASDGWVCISANYRLQPQASFPDPLLDVKKVLAWVREHAAQYGADPATVLTAGSSAGGHLALMAALTPNRAEFQPGFEEADTSVTAAISLYAWYGAVHGGGPESAPSAYVGPDAPAVLVIHGGLDSRVPVEGAREFVADLRRASTAPVAYAELPGAQHSFDLFASTRFEAVVNAGVAFAERVRSAQG